MPVSPITKGLAIAAPSDPEPFATTETITVSTTTSATVGAVVYLTIPTPLTPETTSYTTLPLPKDPTAKAYPNALPVLVLTQLNAVVFDPVANEIVQTITTIQQPPPGAVTVSSAQQTQVADAMNGWSTYPKLQQDIMIAAFILVAIGVIYWVLVCLKDRERSRLRSKDVRESYLSNGIDGSRAEDILMFQDYNVWPASFDEKATEEEKGLRIKSKSKRTAKTSTKSHAQKSQEAFQEPKPRMIIGLEDIEIGPAAIRTHIASPPRPVNPRSLLPPNVRYDPKMAIRAPDNMFIVPIRKSNGWAGPVVSQDEVKRRGLRIIEAPEGAKRFGEIIAQAQQSASRRHRNGVASNRVTEPVSPATRKREGSESTQVAEDSDSQHSNTAGDTMRNVSHITFSSHDSLSGVLTTRSQSTSSKL